MPPDATTDNASGNILILTSLVASMVVNALVTGLIVFKILKVFLEVKTRATTSVERTLNSLSSTGGTKLRHIIFIIIESGMALFAIQLARVVITIRMIELQAETPAGLRYSLDAVVVIQKMLNVIIRSIHFYFFLFY